MNRYQIQHHYQSSISPFRKNNSTQLNMLLFSQDGGIVQILLRPSGEFAVKPYHVSSRDRSFSLGPLPLPSLLLRLVVSCCNRCFQVLFEFFIESFHLASLYHTVHDFVGELLLLTPRPFLPLNNLEGLQLLIVCEPLQNGCVELEAPGRSVSIFYLSGARSPE